ncbi:RidA family protein [Poriferisphaera sp. WC338]|uniref:RidA family protein n=1 Tax=Poriferisphaera sp. WC338 TaxID=3425129 RepID=UPI003D812C39
MDIEAKLVELGYELPAPPKSVAAYVPWVISGNHLILSGQLPMKNGELIATGPIPSTASLEQAKAGAAQCAVNALAAISGALDGDFDRLIRIVRLGVFVASDIDFTEQHLVANGASELLGEVLGDRGIHARSAVGVPSLPLGASVEVEVMVEIKA